ncbi:MAG: glycosyltransferase, partial [Bacilli bacterium]
GAGYCASGIKKQFSIPYVITEHDSSLITSKISKETTWFAKKAYFKADKLIAVGTVLKKSMERLTDKSITVIPNILPDTFHIMDSVIKENRFTFISVGNLIKRKRMDLTISAFAKLYEKDGGIQLKIVGDGSLRQELLKLAKEKGVDHVVEFLGERPNKKIPEIYNKCHCFVLPSEAETFGVVYAEAAACGLPVIATDCGGPKDIVNSNNGFLIKCNDIEALYTAMCNVYINYKDFNIREISENMLDCFGKARIIQALVESYEEIQNEK